MGERLTPEHTNSTPQQLNADLARMADLLPKVSISDVVGLVAEAREMSEDRAYAYVEGRRVHSQYTHLVLSRVSSLVSQADITDHFRKYIVDTFSEGSRQGVGVGFIARMEAREVVKLAENISIEDDAITFITRMREQGEAIIESLGLPMEDMPMVLAAMHKVRSSMPRTASPETITDLVNDQFFFLDLSQQASGGIFAPNRAGILEKIALERKIQETMRLQNKLAATSSEELAREAMRSQWEAIEEWSEQFQQRFVEFPTIG
jgi:hypothetical protein